MNLSEENSVNVIYAALKSRLNSTSYPYPQTPGTFVRRGRDWLYRQPQTLGIIIASELINNKLSFYKLLILWSDDTVHK